MVTTLIVIAAVLLAVVVYDLTQRRHAILRNFPVIGHFRYWFESVGPELRQYIVTNNDEERPFSRDQRRWVYTASKQLDTYFGFGSDNEMESVENYLIIRPSAFPLGPLGPAPGQAVTHGQAHGGQTHGGPAHAAGADGRAHPLACAKELGGFRGRRRAFRPASLVNVSAMSFGSLSGRAIEALNRGCAAAGALHNTGEGGVSSHHRHGADLVWQIGTGYFGCREADGRFSLERLVDTVQAEPRIRALEIKLSQGAKPGVGGILPGAKVIPEIAAARGVPVGSDCISPPRHAEFDDASGLLDFIERLADASGLPVGLKSAVGQTAFWDDLARLSATTGRAPDFITIDGGEGGTGAGPLVFGDHVALPFKRAFAEVRRRFAEQDMHQRIVFIGSAKLGFPESALFAFGLGADMVHVAREAMLAIGCIQAQRCHSGHCPTGVATHNRWLVRGLDPGLKAERLAHYIDTLRKELLRLSHACGVEHPGLITGEHFEILDGRFGSASVEQLFGLRPEWALPSEADREAVVALMRGEVSAAV